MTVNVVSYILEYTKMYYMLIGIITKVYDDLIYIKFIIKINTIKENTK
jgi:hypothetical protein